MKVNVYEADLKSATISIERKSGYTGVGLSWGENDGVTFWAKDLKTIAEILESMGVSLAEFDALINGKGETQ